MSEYVMCCSKCRAPELEKKVMVAVEGHTTIFRCPHVYPWTLKRIDEWKNIRKEIGT